MFEDKRTANESGQKILTITARFPSLVQPWLITQLIEVQKRGRDNFILAGTADTEVVPDNVRKFNLHNKCDYISISRRGRVVALLKNLLSFAGLRRVIRGLSRYPRVLKSRHLTVSEKLVGLLLLQYMGLRGICLVHSQSEMMGVRLLPITIALQVPMLITFHGLPPEGVTPISDSSRAAYTAVASAILVNTQFAKSQYASLGAPIEKIEIVPQGLRMGDFPFSRRSANDGPVQILSVGRFHPDKGQRYTIDAVGQLVDRGIDVALHLVGNGPERAALEHYVATLGLEPHVNFYSRLSDERLRELYNQAHIFVLASLKSKNQFHEETQGVVLQEAQASGLITIATATGGIPECIDDGVSGFLVPDRSAEALAEKLEFVIQRVDQWPSWQDAGRKWVEDQFSVDVIGAKTADIYSKLIDAGRS